MRTYFLSYPELILTMCVGYLLQGWDVAHVEPTYAPATSAPPIPLPTRYQIRESVALGAYLSVAQEAATCSTQVD